jgi:small-conductance mechanosensitive channel
MQKPIRNARAMQQQQTSSSGTSAPRLSSVKRRTQQRRRRPNQRRRPGDPVKGARRSLKRFSQATILAVAITGFIILLLGLGDTNEVQATVQAPVQMEAVRQVPDTVALIEEVPTEDLVAEVGRTEEGEEEEEIGAREAAGEAISTIRGLFLGFYRNIPRLGLAIIILVIAWGMARLAGMLLYRVIGHWNRSAGVITITSIGIWLFFIGVAVSVVVGDIRALIGSLGLIGLALSWSLQTPIESFTGWLLNSFQGYYRVGDRISVGDVFGDVYKIDFLTTTIWEIGGPQRAGFVQAEQPTGRLVTFPNNEVLAGTVVNLTRDFPYVWDEMTVAIANESDLRLAISVLKKIADNLLSTYMAQPSRRYSEILQKAGLELQINPEPQIFVSSTDSWTDLSIRYLVGARERRKWKSELTLLITEELNKPEYSKTIIQVYPRQQVQFIREDGIPAKFDDFQLP